MCPIQQYNIQVQRPQASTGSTALSFLHLFSILTQSILALHVTKQRMPKQSSHAHMTKFLRCIIGWCRFKSIMVPVYDKNIYGQRRFSQLAFLQNDPTAKSGSIGCCIGQHIPKACVQPNNMVFMIGKGPERPSRL